MYHNQIVHHKPCFNLFILHNNLFDNQGSEVNKDDIFCSFQDTVFYENFLPTLLYSFFSLALYIFYIYITKPPKHNSQSSKFYSNKKKSNHFIVQKFVVAPFKGFRLVREMLECTIEFSK